MANFFLHENCDKSFKQQELFVAPSSKVKLANKELHDREAPYYDILHSEIWNFYEQLLIKKDIKQIIKIVGKPAQVLDVGCGTGNLSLKFLMLGSRVTALDISQRMLDILQSKVSNTLKRRICVVCRDVDEFLAEEKEYYDVICFSSVLHHLPNYLATLNLAISKLKPGGIIYIVHEPLPFERVFRNRVIEAVDGYLNCLRIHRKRMTLPSFNYSMTDVHSKKGIRLKSLMVLMQKRNMNIMMLNEYAPHKTWICSILAELLHEKLLPATCARRIGHYKVDVHVI